MAITFNVEENPDDIFAYDDSAGTFSGDLRGVSAFDYFTNDFTVNDAIYFGNTYLGLEYFKNIKIYVGTAMASTSHTIVWEYYDGSNWVTLTVVDNTNGFTATGENWVTFDPQFDWRKTTINGSSAVWVRARVSAVDTPTEGGAQSTQAIKVGNFTITITGYSEGTPCRLSDIYDADVSGSWGVVERFQSSNQTVVYKIKSRQVYWNYNSYFYMNREVLIRDFPGFHTQERSYGWFKAEKSVFIWDQPAQAQYFVNFYVTAGEFYMYNCKFIGYSSTVGKCISINTVGEIKNCSFESLGYALELGGTAAIVVDRYWAKNCGFGFRTANPNAVLSNIYTYDHVTYGLACYWGDGTIVNAEVTSGATYHIIMNDSDPGSTLTLIDCVYDDTKIRITGSEGCEIHDKHKFNLTVTDDGGTAIENATVTVKDKDGTEVFSVTTDANGEITEQTFMRRKWVGLSKTLTESTPHTITISANGYKTYTNEWTITEKTIWEIAVSDSDTVIYDSTLYDSTIY